MTNNKTLRDNEYLEMVKFGDDRFKEGREDMRKEVLDWINEHENNFEITAFQLKLIKLLYEKI